MYLNSKEENGVKTGVYLNKQKFWEETIEKQRASRMSIEDWCRKNKVPISRFLVWEKRVSLATSTTTTTVFEPVQLRASSTKTTLTINGNIVTCEKEMLKEVIALLT